MEANYETKKTVQKAKLNRLVKLGMLTAVSVVLVALVRFPIFPAASFLEYDPADIPIMIGTFAFGPLYGLALTVVVSLLQGLTVSAGSGIYGIIMHVISTGTYMLVAGFIYKAHKSKRSAAIAMLCGTLAMAAVMAGANLLITPYFMGAPVSAVKAMLFTVIVPFNLIKAGVNSLVTFFVYKGISPLLHKNA